jgi:hypothetical protein
MNKESKKKEINKNINKNKTFIKKE